MDHDNAFMSSLMSYLFKKIDKKNEDCSTL